MRKVLAFALSLVLVLSLFGFMTMPSTEAPPNYQYVGSIDDTSWDWGEEDISQDERNVGMSSALILNPPGNTHQPVVVGQSIRVTSNVPVTVLDWNGTSWINITIIDSHTAILAVAENAPIGRGSSVMFIPNNGQAAAWIYVVATAPPEQPTTVTTWAGLQNAINNVPANTPTTIQVGASFNATGNAINIPANRNITLVGTTTIRTITQTANGQRHFIVNGSLTLGSNITLQGGTAMSNTNNAGGVEVRGGGHLFMNVGSTIRNCRRTIVGGAVSLIGSGIAVSTRARFTMNGGTLIGNRATNGGAVNIGTNSVMRMYGGSITNNETSDNSAYANVGGGGVRLSNSTSEFTLINGSISNNRSARHGGGVHVGTSGAHFRMNGGDILGNSAANHGGGVGISSSSATNRALFVKSGGTIRINFANNGGGIGSTATTGAISGPEMNITGGRIYENLALSSGGGIHVAAGGSLLVFHSSAIRIERNTANAGGGGVNVLGTATNVASFSFSRGSILNNTAVTGSAVRFGNFSQSNIRGGTLNGNLYFSKVTTGGQQMSNWCWVAGARWHAMHYFNDITRTQTQAVTNVLGSPANLARDFYHVRDAARYFYSAFGTPHDYIIRGTTIQNRARISEENLRFVLNSHTVLIGRGRYTANNVRTGGHLYKIIGYYRLPNGQYRFILLDPMPIQPRWQNNPIQTSGQIRIASYSWISNGQHGYGQNNNDQQPDSSIWTKFMVVEDFSAIPIPPALN